MSGPNLVLIGGYPGTGKSSMGRSLAARTGWALLDKDVLSGDLVSLLMEQLTGDCDDRYSREYFDDVRSFEYRSLIDTGLAQIAAGNSAILVAPFLREAPSQEWSDGLAALAGACDARLHWVWMTAGYRAMHQRLADRGLPRDRHKLHDWATYSIKVDQNLRPLASAGMTSIVVDNDTGRSIDGLDGSLEFVLEQVTL